jgi:nucleotide-binding universal stress UspA family protein
MTLHKILIPLDGSAFSRQILPTINELFHPESYELILLRVAPPPQAVTDVPPLHTTGAWPHVTLPPRSEEYAQHTISLAEVEESVRSDLQDELLRQLYRLEQRGYRVTTLVRFGEPSEEIVAVADAEGVDLVAMATHGRTGFAHMLVGSVAERVLRHLTIPVMMLRPAELL